jgi:hypothetical protein
MAQSLAREKTDMVTPKGVRSGLHYRATDISVPTGPKIFSVSKTGRNNFPNNFCALCVTFVKRKAPLWLKKREVFR